MFKWDRKARIMTPQTLRRKYFQQEGVVSCWILLAHLVKYRQCPLHLGIWHCKWPCLKQLWERSRSWLDLRKEEEINYAVSELKMWVQEEDFLSGRNKFGWTLGNSLIEINGRGWWRTGRAGKGNPARRVTRIYSRTGSRFLIWYTWMICFPVIIASHNRHVFFF